MIIGITGSFGAGKGEVVAYLVREKGFTHYSARNFFAEQMTEAGIAINRDTMIDFANELRRVHGPRYVFDELFKKAQATSTPSVIESIRAVGEAEALKEQGGVLLSIDADQKVRYERIHGRGSALDQVTFDEFKAQEAREMHSDDPNKQNIRAVMNRADFTLQNNGTLDELHAQIEEVLTSLEIGSASGTSVGNT